MSAQGTGAALLTAAGVGWISVFRAEFLLLGIAGAAVIIIALAILIVMALIICVMAAAMAIEEHDYVWQANIVLAPVVASLSVFVLHGLYDGWWNFLIGTGKYLTNSQSFLGAPLVALALGFCMLASIVLAPVIGVGGMCTESRAWHLASYIGFLYTASFWVCPSPTGRASAGD